MKIYTCLLSIIIAWCLNPSGLYGMKNSPKPPKKTELEQHLQRFRAGKIKKNSSKPFKKIDPPATTELSTHFDNFAKGATKKPIEQKKCIDAKKTVLQKKFDLIQLRKAVQTNDPDTVKRLLKEGVNPNHPNNVTEKTMVHFAATAGNAEVLEILLDHPHIDHEALDVYSHPPIFYAVDHNNPQCVGLLLEHKTSIGPDVDNYTGFHLAIKHKHAQALVALFTYCVHIKNDHTQDNDNNNNAEEEIIELVKPSTLVDICLSVIITQTQVVCLKKIPIDMCEALAKQMSFSQARKFVSCCLDKEKKLQFAHGLAQYYAGQHLENITLLLQHKSDKQGFTHEIAQDINASEIIKKLSHPKTCISQLTLLLQSIKKLKPLLAKDPNKQDPSKLFHALFTYRLQGKSWDFRHLKLN